MGDRQAQSSLVELRHGLEAGCSGRPADDCEGPREGGAACRIGQFVVLREINRGATAVVYEAVNASQNGRDGEARRVALKVINTTQSGTYCIPVTVIQSEIKCSSLFDHRNIASLYDVVADGHKLALALEFVDGPDLLDYTMRCDGAVPEENVVHYFRQLLDAVAHMHATGITHRDLKPENCMIDLRTHTLKVIDFGLAAPVAAHIRRGCGTIFTIAPECVVQSASQRPSTETTAVDVWGLGVTLYIALAGRFPFQDLARPSDDQATIRNTVNGRMHPLPERVSAAGRDLVGRLLQTDPVKRPSLEDISCHPFVQQRVRFQRMFAHEAQVFGGCYGLPVMLTNDSEDTKVEYEVLPARKKADRGGNNRHFDSSQSHEHISESATSPLKPWSSAWEASSSADQAHGVDRDWDMLTISRQRKLRDTIMSHESCSSSS